MNAIKKLFSHQEFRFLFVGGLNTVVGYGLYALFLYWNLNYIVANTLSTILGVFHSYLWNRFFTFQSNEKALRELLRFIMVYVVSYLLGTVSLFLFVSQFHLNQYLAGGFNLIITTLISWFGHKYFSFRKKDLNE